MELKNIVVRFGSFCLFGQSIDIDETNAFVGVRGGVVYSRSKLALRT